MGKTRMQPINDPQAERDALREVVRTAHEALRDLRRAQAEWHRQEGEAASLLESMEGVRTNLQAHFEALAADWERNKEKLLDEAWGPWLLSQSPAISEYMDTLRDTLRTGTAEAVKNCMPQILMTAHQEIDNDPLARELMGITKAVAQMRMTLMERGISRADMHVTITVTLPDRMRTEAAMEAMGKGERVNSRVAMSDAFVASVATEADSDPQQR